MIKSFARFSYADRKLTFKGKRLLQGFLVSLVNSECGIPCRLSYVFCSDTFLHGINLSYLGHDNYTDIITFDLSEDRSKCIEGEIYISVDRVKENSLQYVSGFEGEMLRVIFHGALHLCGFKDKSISDKRAMRNKEDYYLSLFSSKGFT